MSGKVVDYQVVWEEKVSTLEASARKLIAKGWEPVGGITIMVMPPKSIPMGPGMSPMMGPPLPNFLQAMVKRED